MLVDSAYVQNSFTEGRSPCVVMHDNWWLAKKGATGAISLAPFPQLSGLGYIFGWSVACVGSDCIDQWCALAP